MPRRDKTRGTAAQSTGAVGAKDQPPADERAPAVQPETKPGWQRVEHLHMPRPTYWPAVLALGITFIAWGIISSYLITAAGLLLFVVAIAGWTGELLHGH